MKKKITKKRILPVLLWLLSFIILMPGEVFAAETIDPEMDATLTIDYQYGDTVLSGAEFEVYHVATVSPSMAFSLTPDFSGYPVSLDGLDSEGWYKLALTLTGYVWRDDLTPSAKGTTDEAGKLVFHKKPGLYLVIGKALKKGNCTYTSAPFMVALPDMDMAKNTYQYDVTVNPKVQKDCEKNPGDPNGEDPGNPPETIERKVLKVWKDEEYAAERPKEITVQLLCDGEIYDTVILNASNNWRKTWEGLAPGHDWLIVEKEVEGYTVQVSQEGITFVVTNTKKPRVEIPKEPPTKPQGKIPGTHTPDVKLPQTGVPWLPVLMLFLGGMLFLSIGLYGRRKDRDA